MKQASEDKNDIFCSVFTELKTLGVKVPKIKKFKSSIPKQTRPFNSIPTYSDKIFGAYISAQEKIAVADYLLPKFIVASTSYLNKFTKKEIGLFRKAGSISRQRDLRAKLERGESIEGSEPNDVASLLKQWLRELPEPLIPSYLQDLFVRCLNLNLEENRIGAVLLCCHLLPVDHLQTLKHLLLFLSEIANNSDKNKMGAHNLALIMAPNIFVLGTDSIDKSSNNLIHQHTSVIELLINNVHRVELPSCSSLHLAEAEALKNSDLDLSIDVLDYSPSKSKKKRKSGPVQDLFTGFRKLVGQNSVSPNPTRRLNQHDGKSTESRFASKRKADPDQLSMSPLKKLATASNISHNETPNFTPNNKNTQSIFGTREKTGSAHSRRKSFGLLRRKEKKRQKSAKSCTAVETKLSIGTPSTPYRFQEKLDVSFKESPKVQEISFDKSSAILSPIDIEKLFSKTVFAKKSVSDCYLTVPNDKLKNRFSTSSSEGCLYAQENQSPYFLRSDRVMKRKSDVLISKPPEASVDLTEEDKENTGTSCSPWFNRKSSKNSSRSKRRFSKQQVLSPEHVNASPNATDSFSKNNGFNSNVSDKTDTPQTPFRRSSSHKKKDSECVLEDKNVYSLSKVKKPVSDKDLVRSDVIDVNDSVPGVISAESGATSAIGKACTTLQNKEIIKRKCSISRQEAFIIKPKNSRRNTLSQLKRADSIKISKSKNNRINHQNNGLSSDSKPIERNVSNHPSEVIAEKKNENTTSINTSNKKRTRRNVRNGSIVRGRPNTVNTGLPPAACSRYISESFSIKNHRNLASTSSVDNDLFINVVNQSEGNDPNMSITLQIQNITLSSPKEDNFATNSDVKNSMQKCTFETTVSNSAAETTVNDVRETKNVTKVSGANIAVDVGKTNTNSSRVRRSASRRKARDRLCSNSDSKIHKMKKKSSKVSRINSFPEPAKKLRARSAKKLRAVKSSSPRRTLGKENANSVEVAKENVLVLESSTGQSSHVLKTPVNNIDVPDTWVSGIPRITLGKENANSVEVAKENVLVLESSAGQSSRDVFKTPVNNMDVLDTWVSGRKYLESEELTQEEVFNKRESIAMILKNNPGHVKAKANMYDYKTQSYSAKSSMMLRRSTPGARLYDPQYSDMQAKVSQRRSASARTNKSVRKNYPLPPPPKFVIPDSPPIPSYPLKDISNSEDITFSPSPSKKPLSTTNKDKISAEKLNKKCTLKPKRNSYSGHTPYKLPVDRSKVFRSESSPLLRKIAKKSQESLTTIDDVSSPASNVNGFSSPVF